MLGGGKRALIYLIVIMQLGSAEALIFLLLISTILLVVTIGVLICSLQRSAKIERRLHSLAETTKQSKPAHF